LRASFEARLAGFEFFSAWSAIGRLSFFFYFTG